MVKLLISSLWRKLCGKTFVLHLNCYSCMVEGTLLSIRKFLDLTLMSLEAKCTVYFGCHNSFIKGLIWSDTSLVVLRSLLNFVNNSRENFLALVDQKPLIIKKYAKLNKREVAIWWITTLETRQVLFFCDAMHPGTYGHCRNSSVSRTTQKTQLSLSV